MKKNVNILVTSTLILSILFICSCEEDNNNVSETNRKTIETTQSVPISELGYNSVEDMLADGWEQNKSSIQEINKKPAVKSSPIARQEITNYIWIICNFMDEVNQVKTQEYYKTLFPSKDITFSSKHSSIFFKNHHLLGNWDNEMIEGVYSPTDLRIFQKAGPTIQEDYKVLSSNETLIHEYTIQNYSSTDEKRIYEYTHETTTTAEWHVNVTAGMNMSTSIKVPFIASADVSISLDLETGGGGSTSETHTYVMSTEALIPARMEQTIQIFSRYKYGKYDYKMPCSYTGNLQCQVNSDFITEISLPHRQVEHTSVCLIPYADLVTNIQSQEGEIYIDSEEIIMKVLALEPIR